MSFVNFLTEEKIKLSEAYVLEDHTDKIPLILNKNNLNLEDFLALISPSASSFLEQMARRSRDITLKRFGKNISLYAPLYVSNACINTCTYCGFSRPHKIQRRTLGLDEVEKEAIALRKTGIRHVLMLTGESPKHNPVSYLKDCIKIMQKHFDMVQIEIYPLSVDEYRDFYSIGTEGVVVYQETYDRNIYDQVHIAGFKKDFNYRLETPERISDSGIRRIGIGALLGLAPWRKDIAALAMHLRYLEKYAWRSSLSISFPRIREAAQYLPPEHNVSDRELLQIITAFRLFSPNVGINISTREVPEFRDAIIGLGVTAMSAGSRTDIGGYSGESNSTEQFVIEDYRSVPDFAAVIKDRGFEPVFKDWDTIISNVDAFELASKFRGQVSFDVDIGLARERN